MNNYEKKYKETLDKAKRYDEVFNAAKEWYNNPNSSSIGKSYLYAVFPELKEDEDDRIRKGLIKAFGSIGKKEWGGVNVKNAIAWLEKQGRHANFRNKIQIGDKVTRNENGALVNLSQLKRIAKPAEEYNITGIGSKNAQGKLGEMIKNLKPVNEVLEQNHANKVEPKFKVKYAGNEYNVFEVKDIAGVTYYGIEDEPNHIDYVLPDNCEIVSEQKLADKVEPKFKDGQWIVWQNKYYKINYNGCGYELVDQNGLNTSLEYGTIDENAHLFTIEDAKDGDLIYSRHNTESFEWIGIFKSLDKENKGVHFYGFWNNVTKTFKVCGNELFVLYDDFSPATKEQRDTLIKAMADAGYTFDFEKKELKKIEQKPTWSEEDERQWNNIYDVLDGHFELSEEGYKNAANWFKAIKGRVQPQSKQEWSVEDRSKIQRTCKYLAEAKKYYADITEVRECIDWLKSLRPQNKYAYNPYKAVVESIAEMCKHYDKANHSGLRDFYDNVKVKCKDAKEYDSLYPQTTWKPSDEQMKALNYVVNLMASSGGIIESYYYNVFKDLREQLKKLK